MPTDVLDSIAESAIRSFLLFLDDPSKLIDHELIEQLQAKLREAHDPIERLKVYAELERAQHPDGSTYMLDFVLHAKNWADANNVSATAFKQVGVNDDVLRSAGLLADEGRRSTNQRTQQRTSARTSVTVEMIKRHVRSLHGRFTLADVQSGVGGSPMTVRKGVQELVDIGAITRLGPEPDWRGRGRAPIVFDAP